MAQSTSPQQLSSFVEIERKILPTADLMARLNGDYADHVRLQHLGHGAASHSGIIHLSFFRLPDKRIRDTYYDSYDQLSQSGIWLRLRTSSTIRSEEFPLVHDGQPVSEWEAKMCFGGDYNNSQFVELRGRSNIVNMISQRFPAIAEGDLEVLADLATHRSTWIVRDQGAIRDRRAGEMRIVIDRVQIPNDEMESPHAFQHLVGEVEMTKEVVGGADQQQHEDVRHETAKNMQAAIDGSWLVMPISSPSRRR